MKTNTLTLLDFPEEIRKGFIDTDLSLNFIEDKIEENFQKGFISRDLYLDCCDILEKGGKRAVIGEIREFKDGKYQKTSSGWVPVKGTQPSSNKPDIEMKNNFHSNEWLEKFKQYKLNAYPINVPKDQVIIDLKGDINSHAVLKWTDPKTKVVKRAYTQEFMERNAAKKWERIHSISDKNIKAIKKYSYNEFINSELDSSTRSAAAIVYIIANTGLRRGDVDKFKVTGNRGVSTLGPDNVLVKGNTISFNFIGKSYQENTAKITDKKLAEFIAELKESRKNEEFLFETTPSKIDGIFKSYAPEGVKIKDMRTYVATDKARELLSNAEIPNNFQELPKTKQKKVVNSVLKEVYEKVSQVLNNTPTMAKNSYIHPIVVNKWLQQLNYQI